MNKIITFLISMLITSWGFDAAVLAQTTIVVNEQTCVKQLGGKVNPAGNCVVTYDVPPNIKIIVPEQMDLILLGNRTINGSIEVLNTGTLIFDHLTIGPNGYLNIMDGGLIFVDFDGSSINNYGRFENNGTISIMGKSYYSPVIQFNISNQKGGLITNKGQFGNINSNSYPTNALSLTNRGKFVNDAGGVFFAIPPSNITNYDTIINRGDFNIGDNGLVFGTQPGTLSNTNTGVVLNGSTFRISYSADVGVNVSNQGRIENETGDSLLLGGGSNSSILNSGTILNNGFLRLTHSMTSTGQITNNNLFEIYGRLLPSLQLNITGGTLTNNTNAQIGLLNGVPTDRAYINFTPPGICVNNGSISPILKVTPGACTP